MKKKLFLLALTPILLLLLMTIASCNNSNTIPEIVWQTAFRGADWNIEQTNDGGFIIAGIKAPESDNKAGKYGEKGDYCVAKINKDGKIEWQKALGDYESQGVAAITTTSDNGYILISVPRTQYKDLEKWIIKLDKQGNVQWRKTIENWGHDIQQTSDGGYIITGNIMSEWNTRKNDYWVAKLDAKGDMTWQRNFGGSEIDMANTIRQTVDGGYVIAGYTESFDGDVSNKKGGERNPDYWIVKLDREGSIQWEKTYGGTNEDIANSIQTTTDGGYIVAGSSKSSDGDITEGHHGTTNSIYADYWIVKLDEKGIIQWQKCYGGVHSDYTNSIQQTQDGGYIIGGWSNSNTGDKPESYSELADYWIVKTDKEAILKWQKTLGGTERDEATFIRQTKDGGYLVAGNSGSSDGDVDTSKGDKNIWVMKLK